MKTPIVASLAAVVLLSAAPAAAPVHATTAVLRCQSSDGTAIYTDTGCSAFQARDVPLPAELLNRIAHDAPDANAGTGLPVDPTAVAVRHSPVGSCARTPTQLAMDLRASLAAGDVNRVAESYDWAGLSSKQGERTLDRLQRLTGNSVRDSHYFDAQIGPGGTLLASSATGAGGDAGILQLFMQGNAHATALDFNVHRVDGCYFVSF